jgi:hypothetical protein
MRQLGRRWRRKITWILVVGKTLVDGRIRMRVGIRKLDGNMWVDNLRSRLGIYDGHRASITSIPNLATRKRLIPS